MRPITCKLSSDISTLYTTGRASITSLTTGLLDIPQYTIGTMSSGQNTQYIQYIYKYIGLQLDFQTWYYLLYLPNELKRIFGFVTKACFFRWNQKLIFSRSLVWALLPYYRLISFDKHQFPITILDCSALYSYSRFKKLPQNFFSGTFSRAQKKRKIHLPACPLRASLLIKLFVHLISRFDCKEAESGWKRCKSQPLDPLTRTFE